MNVSDDAMVVKGTYTIDAETRGFAVDLGRTKSQHRTENWWLHLPPLPSHNRLKTWSRLRQCVAMNGRGRFYLTVRGRLSRPGHFGPSGTCSREFYAEELLSCYENGQPYTTYLQLESGARDVATKRIKLRPGIINPGHWYAPKPPASEWRRLRRMALLAYDWTCAACGHHAKKWMQIHHINSGADHTLDNLAPVCVACHAVLHIGNSMMFGTLEIWECALSQLEVVRRTRAGVKRGLSLRAIKRALPLKRGPFPPKSLKYANRLAARIGAAHRASLDRPLVAVFTDLERWQIED